MYIRRASNGTLITNFCPECSKSGQKSTFKYSDGERIGEKIEIDRFYDEEGNKHLHDQNIRGGAWECSKGHIGIYTRYYLCNVRDCEYSI